MSTIAHLTLADYDRMIEVGVFDRREQRRLEFIRGEIREMAPIGSMHEQIVDLLNVWSFENVSKDRIRVRVQNSIGLPTLQSAPEPDLAWVVQRDYSGGRPSTEDVLLVIEVSDSSLKTHTDNDEVRPLAAPEVVLRPSALWAGCSPRATTSG